MLVNRASRAYAAGQQVFPVTMGAAEKTLRVSVTRESWPEGLVLAASIVWEDGSGLDVTFAGGVQTDPGPVPGQTIERLTNDFLLTKPKGVTQGVVTVEILQPMRMAVQVASA